MYALQVDGSIEVFNRPPNDEDALHVWPSRYHRMQHSVDGCKLCRGMLVVSYATDSAPPSSPQRAGREQKIPQTALSSPVNGVASTDSADTIDGSHVSGDMHHEVWCSCDNFLYFYESEDLQPVCPRLQVSM